MGHSSKKVTMFESLEDALIKSANICAGTARTAVENFINPNQLY